MFKGSVIESRVKTKQEQVLDQLSESDVEFHLTGSRFFGTNDSYSDYDFFALDSWTTADFLNSIGFWEKDRSDYLSSAQGINRVYEHFAGNIQVQLISDPDRKARIQDAIKATPGFMNIIRQRNKERIKGMWETLYLMNAGTTPQKVSWNKISCIKRIRELVGPFSTYRGLKEAKDLAEFIEAMAMDGNTGQEIVAALRTRVGFLTAARDIFESAFLGFGAFPWNRTTDTKL